MHSRQFRTLLGCLLATVLAARSANAHFAWLDTVEDSDQTYAVFFFSEGPSERDYHLPQSLEKVTVFARDAQGERTSVTMEKKEAGKFIGLRSTAALKDAVALEATCEYGIYHGNKLVYYVKHLPAGAESKAGPSPELKLDIVPQATKEGVKLRVLWEGRPAADVIVTLSDAEGVPSEETTDKNGEVAFELEEPGLVSVVANRTDESEKGELDGAAYHAGMHFGTLTFHFKPLSQ